MIAFMLLVASSCNFMIEKIYFDPGNWVSEIESSKKKYFIAVFERDKSLMLKVHTYLLYTRNRKKSSKLNDAI